MINSAEPLSLFFIKKLLKVISETDDPPSLTLWTTNKTDQRMSPYVCRHRKEVYLHVNPIYFVKVLFRMLCKSLNLVLHVQLSRSPITYKKVYLV